MIQITKAQAEYLRANGVKEGITRTMYQKSKRKHYYCAEENYIMKLLNEFDSKETTFTYNK